MSNYITHLLDVPEAVRSLTVRTPCHNPASLLKSRTLVMVSAANQRDFSQVSR